LGLPIAKNILEGLGGTIAVASSAQGTRIRVELPLEPAAERPADAAHGQPVATH
jgi:signal transduction histidine kinase